MTQEEVFKKVEFTMSIMEIDLVKEAVGTDFALAMVTATEATFGSGIFPSEVEEMRGLLEELANGSVRAFDRAEQFLNRIHKRKKWR